MSRPLARILLALGLPLLSAMILLANQKPAPDRDQPRKVAVKLVGKIDADNVRDPLGLTVVGKYAYVTDAEDGLIVVDVSNATAPKRVGFCSLPGSARDVAVAGRYAYVATREGGLRVVDVSNPKAPAEVGFYRPRREVQEGAVEAGPLVERVAVAGKHVYAIYSYVPKDKNARRNVLQVLDISNPKAPAEVGSFETDRDGQFLGVAVVGKHAYVADKASTLWVVDISDHKTPAAVGSCNALGEPHGVFVLGNHAYIPDDDGAMHIVDISEPKSPRLVGSYEDGGDRPGIAEAVAVAGMYAYVCDVGRALRVVDVSDTKAPKEVASFDTAWPPRGVTVADGYIYVNVWRGGLFILKLTEQIDR